MENAAESVLYYLTLFTFIVIFFFCYILQKYTFFHKKEIQTISRPSFPFGNVYDVVFGERSMAEQLLKFYRKLQRNGCKTGGFYIFQKPAVLIQDLKQARDMFEIGLKTYGSDPKIFENDALLRKISENTRNFWENRELPLKDHNSKTEINMSRVFREFIGNSLSGFCRTDFGEIVPFDKYTNFFKLFSLGVSQKIACFFIKKQQKNVKQCLNEVLKRRKENDEKPDDILQIMIENSAVPVNAADGAEFLFGFIEILYKAANLILLCLNELSDLETKGGKIQEELRKEIGALKQQKIAFADLKYLEMVVKGICFFFLKKGVSDFFRNISFISTNPFYPPKYPRRRLNLHVDFWSPSRRSLLGKM